MDLPSTLLGLGLSVMIFGWANWRQRRDWSRLTGTPSLLPLTLIQMAAAVAFLVLAAHLISLLTGTPFRGRIQY